MNSQPAIRHSDNAVARLREGPFIPFQRVGRLEGASLIVGRYRIPYRIAGSSGPLLVAVNGAQQTMASWSAVLRYLVPRGLRLLIFDGPGQGRTEVIEGPPAASLAEQLAVAKEFVSVIARDEPVRIIGASWGSVLAAQLAAELGKQVDRLLLVSLAVRANTALANCIVHGRALIEQGRNRELGELFVERFGAGLPANFREGMLRQFVAMSRESLAHLYEHSGEILRAGRLEEYIDLARIQARTMILNGALDPFATPEEVHAVARLIPRGSAHIEPDVGHFMHLEKPAKLELYARFLMEE